MTDINTTPQPAEQPKKSKRRGVALAVGALVLTLSSCGVGAAMGGGAKTVTAPPTPTKTITKTETKVINTVPNECMIALQKADEIMAIVPRFASSSSDAMQAAADGDINGLSQANEEIKQQTADLTPLVPVYTSNRDSCRDAQ